MKRYVIRVLDGLSSYEVCVIADNMKPMKGYYWFFMEDKAGMGIEDIGYYPINKTIVKSIEEV